MAIKLIFGNLKGGSGKTTTAMTMALLLQEQARKTLLIDLDPQANVTHRMANIFLDPVEVGNLDVYGAIEQKDLRKGLRTLMPYLDLIPSSSALHNFPQLLTETAATPILPALIEEIEDDYEFIIFDVSPMIDELAVNALASTDYVVAILEPTPAAIQKLNLYFNYIEEIKTNQNPSLQVLGIVASMITPIAQSQHTDFDNLSAPVKELLFESVIPNRNEEGVHPKDNYGQLLDEILKKL